MMLKKVLPVAVLFVALAVPARAEIVFFNTGRNLSVQSHHVDAGTVVMEMRGGGEMTVDASLVAHIEPDEVPYPEPAVIPEAPGTDTTAVTDPAVHLATTSRFDAIIRTVAKEQGVDATLVRAVI